MGNLKICRVCSGADPKREKDGMIRCVQKHKFVDPEGTCQDHSNKSLFITPEFKKELMQAYIDGLENMKGKAKK